jgi:hypothetical protein
VPNPFVLKADFPHGAKGAAASVVDGKIYLICGIIWVGEGKDAGRIHPNLDDIPDLELKGFVRIYDPVIDTWERGADMPTPRYLGVSASKVDKIYLFGGSF